MRWRAPMDDRRFARQLRRLARRSKWRGQIDRDQFEEIIDLSYDEEALAIVRQKIDTRFQSPWQQDRLYSALDFSSFWNWLKENWPDILQFILSVLPLFLMEKPNEAE